MQYKCKFSQSESKKCEPVKFEIESEVSIYRYENSLFQIGELEIDENYKHNIISLLTLGNKFIPNYFFSKEDYFNYLLNLIDNNILNLNTNLYINKNSNQNYNSRNFYDTLDTNINEMVLNDKYFDLIYKNFRKRNISSKKIDNEKIFITKEIDNFRSNIYSQLLNNYSKIKIKPNITFTQLKYFMKFQKEKNFKIINCDKNVGNAILSNELYRNSAIASRITSSL